MTRRGIRFRPPGVTVAPELRWVLLRAFGPPSAPGPSELDPERALELARLFEIVPRIAARQARAQLMRELGRDVCDRLLDERQSAVFLALQRVAAAQDVARISAVLEVPLVFLKFLALHYSGFLLDGSREAVDIDLLAPGEALDSLYGALCDAGYQPRDQPPSEHHLPALDHPQHGAVEIHRFIPGVRLVGDASATVGALTEHGLLSPLPSHPGQCWLPSRDLLVAHALAHGIAQHGHHPDAYSGTRMIADLIDLTRGDGRVDRVYARAQEWIADVVSPEETLAVQQLCESLGQGAGPWSDALPSDSPAGVYLRHVISGVLDSDYLNALNLRFFDSRLPDRGSGAALAALLKKTFFLTRGQIDKIYGQPKSSTGYLVRRLLRPLSLLGRLLRYIFSSIRLRLRRRF